MPKSLYTQVGEVKGPDLPDQVTFTHQYTPTSEATKSSRGSLFTLITLHESDRTKATQLGKEIYQTFQSAYYSSSVGGVLAALEAALDHVNKFVKDKGSVTSLPKFELVASVLWGEALYLVKTQGAGVIFQRNQTTKKLSFTKAASGALKEGDTVCLANQKFIEEVDINSLTPALTHDDFQETLKSLDSLIAKSNAAFTLVIRVYIEEPKQEVLEMVDVSGSKTQSVSLINKIKNRVVDKLPVMITRTKVIFSYLKSKISYGSSFVLNKILEPWRPREPGAIEDPAKRRRARSVQVAVVLVILLTLSIGGAVINRSNSARLASFNDKLDVTEVKLNEIDNLTAVNPERAEELLDQVETDLAEAKKFNIEADKLKELENLFASLQGKIRKIYDVALEAFSSLEGVKISDLVQTDTSFVVLDRDQSKIIVVARSSKDRKEVGSDSGMNLIAEFSGVLYVQKSQGIKKINLSNLKTEDFADPSSNWGKLVSAGTYKGNLYLLDQDKKEIWKYTPFGDGFSSPQAYFKGDKRDFGSLSAMTIDGAIWVGNTKGVIMKFLTGKRQKFEINGLDKPFGGIIDIFTTVGSNTLFILDNDNKRVVLIDKNGKYLSQYTSEEFGVASTLSADEKNRTIYLGVGSNLKFFKYD